MKSQLVVLIRTLKRVPVFHKLLDVVLKVKDKRAVQDQTAFVLNLKAKQTRNRRDI